jgi:hypothetical protein
MEVKVDFRLAPKVIVNKKKVPRVDEVAEKQKTKREKRGWFA